MIAGLFSAAEATAGPAGSLAITEFMADNDNFLADERGNFNDWLEIGNRGTVTIDLGGYYLSDDTSDLVKSPILDFRIMPGSCGLIWADGRDSTSGAAAFRLNKESGVILLTAPDGKTVISRVSYARQETDVSMVLHAGNWYYSDQPSPGAQHQGSRLYRGLAGVPGIDFANTGSSVVATIGSEDGSAVRYTTDGSSPFGSNALSYDGPFTIDSTIRMIRAIAVGEGLLTKREAMKAFIEYGIHDLPVVSLVTDPANLWDDETGIYTMGNHENCTHRSEEWVRPGYIEYYAPGEEAVTYPVDYKIFGSGTRVRPKKSLTVLAASSMKNHFFSTVESSSVDGFVLRACYSNDSRFRNEVAYGVNRIMDSNCLMQEYRPVVLYMNGEYFGLFNLTERKNTDFIERHSGVRPEHIITCGRNYIHVVKGSGDAYSRFVDSLNRLDMNGETIFDYIAAQIDLHSMTDHYIHDMYTNKVDMFNNRLWHSGDDAAQWNYVNYDFDNCFLMPPVLYTPIYKEEASGIHIIGRLLLNDRFRELFFSRLCDFMNFGYTEKNVAMLLEASDALTREEFRRDYQRWKDLWPNCADRAESQKRSMMSYIPLRNAFLRDSVAAAFGFRHEVVIENHEPSKGTVYVNGYKVEDRATYFSGMPLEIRAEPVGGYLFKGWKSDIAIPLQEAYNFIPEGPMKIEPVFEQD
jgi:hypothetical protein